MSSLKYPTDCINAMERTEYCYRAQEVLRLEHNAMGKKFRDGDITADDWQTFLNTVFEPMSTKITADLLQARAELKISTRWDITLDNIKEEK